MKKLLLALLALSVLFALIWFTVFRSSGSTSNDSQYSIETASVERGDVARIVSASGTVRALTTVEVGSQVSGQIIELDADFNSEVSQDQIIAKLDPQTFESRVSSAKADVVSAKANIDVQKAQIARSQANLTLYENDYQRQTELFEQKLIPRSLLDDAERQLAVGRSDLSVSQAQLRSVQAMLAQRQAALDSARVDLERTIIRSPINGVVIERNVDVGQTVAASLSAPVLFRIAQDLQDIRIDADVVESDIGGINAGDLVNFKVDTYPDDDFTGVVEQVRLAAKELQNVVTYTVVIAAENQRGRLLPGMTANVEITAENRNNVLRLADAASRFRPPADGPQVVKDPQDTQGPSSGAPGGNGGGTTGQILSDLELDPERIQDIQAKISEEMQSVRESMGGMAQFDRNRMRELIRARIDRVMKKNLSDEEYKSYQDNLKSRTSVRRIELYQENADGSLSVKTVVAGLSDGRYLEVLRGADEGEVFITRLLSKRSED